MPAQKILVVDDSNAVRVQIKRILNDAGYEVITAENGQQALEQLSEDPDLMVLDVMMPELDGYGVCERLADMDGRYDQLPIVFLTSVKSHALELLGQQYGAYLNKPVDEAEFLSTVRERFQLQESN
jgi:CheY-like chemotaxis protein